MPLEFLQSTPGGSYIFAMSRYSVMPGPSVVLTICPQQVGWCQRVSLTQTDDGQTPWHVDYSLRQTRRTPLPAAERVAPLPDQSPPPPPPAMTPFGTLQ